MSQRLELDLTEGTFRAFGSRCRIVTDLGGAAIDRSVERLDDLEARWSRFRPDSEISVLNRSAGELVACSEATIELVRTAVDASVRTDGIFNPLVLRPLLAFGYDRDHRELELASGAVSSVPTFDLASPHAIEISGGAVRIPARSGFDPGGIGKGLAADVVVEDLVDAGATWAWVSLGGDVRFGGLELEQRGTDAVIQHPIRRDEIWGSTRVRGGALASSSTLIRRWRHLGSTHHHLIGPDGRPAIGSRVAATVFAGTAMWADVVAKCLLIDPDAGRHDIARWGVSALIFDETGQVEAHGWSDEALTLGPR